MKIATKGARLELEIESVYTPVVHLTKLDGPDAEVQVFDGTALDSGVSLEDGEPTGHTAPGTLSSECFFDPAQATHQALIALLSAPEKKNWKLVLPNADASEYAFVGVLRKFSPTIAMNDGMKANIEIKLCGLAVFTAVPE